MRFLIACYSVTNHTLKVAGELKSLTGGDLTLIEPVKPESGPLAGINAKLGRKTPIKPCKSDMKGYDALILCTPVCSGRPPAAVNEYIGSLTGTQGKSYAVVVASTKEDLKGTVERIAAALDATGMTFVASMEITQRQVMRGEYFAMADKMLAQFNVASRVTTKVSDAVSSTAEKATTAVKVAKVVGKYGKWMLK